MTDFLLELRSEEIPARMQDKAREDLARLFAAELDKAGLKAAETITYATPRRLTLIARGLPAETAAVSEELKGPRVGAPPQAMEGFLRKTGLAAEQLVERDGVLFAVIDKPGRRTAELLAEAIPAIVRAFPWPKSMRWGEASLSTESLRWVRPLHGIVALFGTDVVPVEIAGVVSGNVTIGHRFMNEGTVTIGSAADYADKLRAAHVIVDQDERRAIIRDKASALATAAGLELIEDEGLVAENAGLTEWPVPLLGRFDKAFLDVPPEVIQLTARVNQKYFVCRESAPLPLAGGAGGGPVPDPSPAALPTPDPSRKREGRLANAFVCTANIEASDGGAAIVEGNRKVLAARLSDARFFYETDLKVPLEEQAKKLGKIVFHEKLGTVADKVERVAKLARWLVESDIVTPAKAGVSGEGAGQESPAAPASAGATKEELADMAERAARLAKADLVTGMVGEFPELQGLMGGYYAAAQGEAPAVAEAIRDHYKPVGQGDDVPTATVTVAVSLADKLDTIAAFFCIDERPTGSKDPFALRRAALGVIALVLKNSLRRSLYDLFNKAVIGSGKTFDMGEVVAADYFYDFIIDRLKVQQRESGVRHDLIDAVVTMGGDDDIGGERDLVRLLARVRALQSFVTTEDGANLLAGYKRAANILKKEDYETPLPAREGLGVGAEPQGSAGAASEGRDPAGRAPTPDPSLTGRGESGLSYTPEKEEADLIAALDAAEPAALDAIGHEDFEAAMAALATLRAPIDAFFDKVTVNDTDPEKRRARLALLARIRAAVHNVADFSRIEG